MREEADVSARRGARRVSSECGAARSTCARAGGAEGEGVAQFVDEAALRRMAGAQRQNIRIAQRRQRAGEARARVDRLDEPAARLLGDGAEAQIGRPDQNGVGDEPGDASLDERRQRAGGGLAGGVPEGRIEGRRRRRS